MLKQTVFSRRYFACSGTCDDWSHVMLGMTLIAPATPY